MGHADQMARRPTSSDPSSTGRSTADGHRSWTSAPAAVRLVAMLIVGVLAALVTGFLGHWYLALATGWDAAALLFVLSVGRAIVGMGAAETKADASRENPGRAVSELIIICASVASLAGVGVLLVRANSTHGTQQSLLAALGVASVALSWFVVHTLFTLRYAVLYYAGPEQSVDFKSGVPPRYTDFAYLAFTVGMTFQVSDTDLRSPIMRANVLRHALLSYLFGAVIIASMINLVAGLGSGAG